MKVKAKQQVTVNDLMVKIMKAKKIKGKEMAERLQRSESHVTQVTTTAKNHWFVTVKEFFEAMDEKFQVLDSDGNVFHVPGTISTIGQLRKHLKTFYFRFESNGWIFEIIPYQVWNE